jgi:cell division topological specificity factor
MLDFSSLSDFFKKLFKPEGSGATARERLRVVLLSDHLALAPDIVESLKTDLIAVISKYVEVDEEHCDVSFEQRERAVAMLANIPIRSMKGRPQAPRPPSEPPPEPPPTLLDGAPASATVTTDQAESDVTIPPPKPRRRRRRRAATRVAPAPG